MNSYRYTKHVIYLLGDIKHCFILKSWDMGPKEHRRGSIRAKSIPNKFVLFKHQIISISIWLLYEKMTWWGDQGRVLFLKFFFSSLLYRFIKMESSKKKKNYVTFTIKIR